MDRERLNQRQAGRGPKRSRQTGNPRALEKELRTYKRWRESLYYLVERIEEEREKIGPLTGEELSDKQIIYDTKELEQLINEFLRLKLAGQRVGYQV